jgi:hypothetical protein
MPTLLATLVATLLGTMPLVSTPLIAETINLKADLKAANEVPPNNSPASGSLTATYDTESKRLTWTLNYQGLTGPVIAAHFHGPADPSKNSGIVVPFHPTASPITGSAVINEAQEADIFAGKWYANIHTAAHPGGEIRGQLLK